MSFHLERALEKFERKNGVSPFIRKTLSPIGGNGDEVTVRERKLQPTESGSPGALQPQN